MIRCDVVVIAGALFASACSTVYSLPGPAPDDGAGGCALCHVASSPTSGGTGGSGGAAVKVKSACIAAVVSNAKYPTAAGKGIDSRWSYAGLTGLQAGEELCHAAGADHVCTLEEIFAADSAGQLDDLPKSLTFWSYRTKPVADPLLGDKPCKVDATDWQKPADAIGNTKDCNDGLGKYCDPETQRCALKPGPGARCNDFIYPTGHLWDGEWFARADATVETFPSGGTKRGSLIVHFDADERAAHVCHDASHPGCAGPCGGAARAIVCCKASCESAD
jgi:hypothetical protein